MLKKIFAKLRESISPSRSAKPAPAAKPTSHAKPHSAAQPQRGEGRHDSHEGGSGRRGQGQSHGGGRGSGGKSHGQSQHQPRSDSAGQASRPRRDEPSDPAQGRHGGRSGGHGGRGERSGGGQGGSQGGRGLQSRSGGGRGGPRGGERERPTIDKSFDHPRTADIKPSSPVDVPKMDTEFTKLGLSDALAYGVQEMGYVTPTPIQAQAIPVVLKGGDVIGSAQTGTGKTAAFALPIIQRLGGHGALRVLILEPTRELALQVEEAFQKFAKFTDLRVTIFYGGVGYGKQEDDLRRGMDIV
ncbi:MAG: DEAD/DEAH box helicase, partial [Opitutaceae bacterium]